MRKLLNDRTVLIVLCVIMLVLGGFLLVKLQRLERGAALEASGVFMRQVPGVPAVPDLHEILSDIATLGTKEDFGAVGKDNPFSAPLTAGIGAKAGAPATDSSSTKQTAQVRISSVPKTPQNGTPESKTPQSETPGSGGSSSFEPGIPAEESDGQVSDASIGTSGTAAKGSPASQVESKGFQKATSATPVASRSPAQDAGENESSKDSPPSTAQVGKATSGVKGGSAAESTPTGKPIPESTSKPTSQAKSSISETAKTQAEAKQKVQPKSNSEVPSAAPKDASKGGATVKQGESAGKDAQAKSTQGAREKPQAKAVPDGVSQQPTKAKEPEPIKIKRDPFQAPAPSSATTEPGESKPVQGPVSVSTASSGQSQGEAAPPRVRFPELRVTGIVGDGRRYMAIVEVERESQIAEMGKPVGTLNVKQITARTVTLEKDGQEVVLRIGDE